MSESTSPTTARDRTRDIIGLLVSLVFCFAASASAFVAPIDDWYRQLEKPAWTPPGWLFGPAWSTLYVTMAIAVWLVWREDPSPSRRLALRLFVLQWVLNAVWTPIFFGLRRPDLALIEIVVLLATVVATIAAFHRVRALAAALLVPYLLWLSFATLLNAAIWSMNR
jgi:translocator protein